MSTQWHEIGSKRCGPLEDGSWIQRFRNMVEEWFKKGKSVGSVRTITEINADHEMFELLKRNLLLTANSDAELRARKLVPEEPDVNGVFYELLVVKTCALAIGASFNPNPPSEESLPLQHPYEVQFQEDGVGGGDFFLFASPETSAHQLTWLKEHVYPTLEALLLCEPSAPIATSHALISSEVVLPIKDQSKADNKPFKKFVSATFPSGGLVRFLANNKDLVETSNSRCKPGDEELKRCDPNTRQYRAHVRPKPGMADRVLTMLQEKNNATYCDCE
ncbi:unnamed protein product, partial [Mesorhabditis spiculigera]